MSALERFEHFVEGLIEGSFTRLMRHQLQPVQIAKRLARLMEAERSISAGKIIVPNEYCVALNPEEWHYYESSIQAWQDELAEYLAGVAREQGFALFGRLVVTLEANAGVNKGQMRVGAKLVENNSIASPVVDAVDFGHTQAINVKALREVASATGNASISLISGSSPQDTFSIDKPSILIGRAMDNDIVLEDPRISRYHAEIRQRGDNWYLHDLKSTNGTRVNGAEVVDHLLKNNDHCSLGGVDLVFRIGL